MRIRTKFVMVYRSSRNGYKIYQDGIRTKFVMVYLEKENQRPKNIMYSYKICYGLSCT